MNTKKILGGSSPPLNKKAKVAEEEATPAPKEAAPAPKEAANWYTIEHPLGVHGPHRAPEFYDTAQG